MLPLKIAANTAEVIQSHRRHRLRFLDWLQRLPVDAAGRPTRCEEWSLGDMVSHLVQVDEMFVEVWRLAEKGDPPRTRAGFDPARTPDVLLAGVRDRPWPKTLAAFRDSTETICEMARNFPQAMWEAPAEVPPGFVPWTASLIHAFWDSWVHERDALIPRREALPLQPDEIRFTGMYVLGFNGLLQRRLGWKGTLTLGLTGPGGGVAHVEIGDAVEVRWTEDLVPDWVPVGHGAAVIDAMSGRGEVKDVLEGRGALAYADRLSTLAFILRHGLPSGAPGL